MFARTHAAVALLAVAGLLTACSESATSPVSHASTLAAAFSGRTVDSTQLAGGGGGGGGAGGGGGGSVAPSCGTLANISTYDITVYTSRTGIGIVGIATNCGTKNEALEVDAVDTNTDPVCAVNMPHFIAVKNTSPGASTGWQVNSTLINCPNTWHLFDLNLIDTKTGQVLATAQQGVFM